MDYTSINKERGKLQFFREIDKDKDEIRFQDTLKFLCDYFKDYVGVMEIIEDVSEHPNKIPRVEVYSAKRMAAAVLHVCDESPNANSALYAEAIDRYCDTKAEEKKAASTTEVKADEHNVDVNTKLMQEIEESAQEDKRSMKDVDNLIYDISEIEYEELSIEGARAVGYLPKDFDTLQNDTPELNVNKIPMALREEDADGNTILLCPECYSDSLYEKGFSRCVCLDCGTEFKSSYNIGDLLSFDN